MNLYWDIVTTDFILLKKLIKKYKNKIEEISMNVEIKKTNINDGMDVYSFLCDIGVGENGFVMTPPKNEQDFKNLLKKYEKDFEKDQASERVSQEIFWMYVNEAIVGIIKIRTKLLDFT